jgi:predicted DNA-binding transcriptional regulator AlpA
MAKKQFDFLPRGLNRAAAAHYIGVSVSFFDQLVSDGRMPHPKGINSRRVWDRHALDSAFHDLVKYFNDFAGNMPPLTGIFPDYMAPRCSQQSGHP